MHKVVYFNPILSQAPKQYLEMTKYMCICDKISLYFSLYYSTIQDSLNCYGTNHDFYAVRTSAMNKAYRFYNSITIKQQYTGFNYGSLAFEKLESTIVFVLTFSVPLERCITKRLVYL